MLFSSEDIQMDCIASILRFIKVIVRLLLDKYKMGGCISCQKYTAC